ncbi:auxin-responsive protein SAUR71-like [Canna indica]|uniref:Auxin-responsive protein SAUR71-like n=1 Tax=Canna indica TaxID=4628 RepID=A0AAQ3QCD3_9LILI|nr:auxin-responsive protein SAUR71-like [Canna indica]
MGIRNKEEGGMVRRGYVPMLVGKKGKEERFVVHTKLFKHPYFVVLLEMAEREFGYNHPGVLRIPCDAEQFRSVVDAAARAKS